MIKICKSCFHEIDAATAIESDNLTPKEGDISICFYCGVISQFDKDGNIVKVADGVIEDIKINQPKDYEMMVKSQVYIKQRIQRN